ncbi:MAG: carbohydrate binding domain-containing protein [Fimbriimonadales bacterium]|nr:carbohydrate binding domain-containing protein [Fimbriimonadales bacterium]
MQTQGSFPWVVPFGSAAQGATDFRFLIDHTPAGSRGRVRVGADGHYYIGKQRIRFWGINITANACFPTQADAVKIADHVAQAGFNIVRFHHLDAFWSSPSVIDYQRGNSRQLSADALARFDYLYAQLRQRGVYADINLLVNRQFRAADGLPPETDQIMWDVKRQHVMGFFFRPMIELQKEYARLLLTHRNPHTGLTYAEDPALAMVEINNENGLLQGWLSGYLDDAPAPFLNDLQRQWNDWLRRKYGNTNALRTAWGEQSEPLGSQMLNNPRFAQGLQSWTLEEHGDARVNSDTQPDGPNGSNSVRLQVMQRSSESWHAQFNQTGLRFEANRLYTVRFHARASQRRTLGVNIGQAYAPWGELGFNRQFEVDTNWREYQFSFLMPVSDTNARLNFYRIAEQTGEVFFADMFLATGGELRVLPDGDLLGEGRVPCVRYRERDQAPPQALRDWHEFLWETERAYWQELANYIKRDLNYQGVVIGTIIGCSTPHLMAPLDAIDAHAYWAHPEFPGTPWDSNNWFIRNEAMINSDAATVFQLALQRIVGKPFTVTEYDHSAPNQYAAEGALLLAAHGALQDWDGLFLFAYSWNYGQGRISDYFDQNHHPAKWTLARACAALFVRGDVRPAQRLICAALTREQELDAVRQVWAWGLPDGRFTGINSRAVTMHRIATALDSRQIPSGALRSQDVSVPSGTRVSDTGELTWNRTQIGRYFFTVAARRSKAAIGFIGGRTLDLGDKFTLEVKDAPLNGFGVVALTVLQEKPVWRALVIAVSTAENTGWNLRNLGENRITVGNQWGSAPTRVSVPTALLTLPYPARRVKAWALDENGARAREVSVSPQGSDRALLELGSKFRTLWYEVEATV